VFLCRTILLSCNWCQVGQKKFRTMTKCTHCGRDRKGHVGPCGRRCKEEPLLVSLKDSDSYDDTSTSDGEETEHVSYTVEHRRQTAREAREKKKMEALEKKEEASEKKKLEAKDAKREVKPQDAGMAEMLRQIGLLSSTVQGLADQNRIIIAKQELHSARFLTMDLGGAKVDALTSGGVVSPGEPAIPLFNGARVSKKTMDSARAGEFINLIEFVPNSEPTGLLESVYDERSGQIVFKNKTVRRTIDGFLAWSQAWAGYESVLVAGNADLYLHMTKYRMFIQKCDSSYIWGAVYSYDQRHRHKLSMSKDVLFDVTDTDIYVTLMNSQSVKPNMKACYRCGSLDHISKDCAFLETSQMEKTPSANPRKTRFGTPAVSGGFPRFNAGTGASAGRQAQVCYNFNAGRCYVSQCSRLHVCQQCGGPDPWFKCYRCNPPPPAVTAAAASPGMGAPYGAASR
jgi:hypothetical protein